MSERDYNAEAKAETVRAYIDAINDATYHNQRRVLADALRDAEARADKAEFHQNHSLDAMYCLCREAEAEDERHNWTDADWQRAADKKLRGENE